MRLGWSKSKYSISYYAQKRVYVDGKGKDIIVARFGSEKEIREKHGVTDAKAWAQARVDELNREDEEENGTVQIELSPLKSIPIGEDRSFNGGYLFLQSIFHELRLDNICKVISSKHRFEYNLTSILSRLIYARILSPSSKKSSFEEAKHYIEAPDFELHQIYRALSVLSEESNYIQAAVYRNSLKMGARRTGVIYYDCTNFFFEIEQEDAVRQYGASKEHRPLPIIGMGMFIDRDGIPLAFSMHPGAMNEQGTLTPIEKKILDDFRLSRFIVCTDAGLSSIENRKFNDYNGEDGSMRAFITVQSVKKMKAYLKEWALSPTGWKLAGDEKGATHDISALDEEADKEKTFYKERWVNDDGLEQRLIVTFSLKYRDYLRAVRGRQLARAVHAVEENPSMLKKKRQNDYKRFVKETRVTEDGEVAEKAVYNVDTEAVREEEKYDGFYAVCTNLEDSVGDIIRVNHWRWQIEECFRIMKSEFKGRPVYLSREDRINAHFLTCFLALIIFRYLEKKLQGAYTCEQLIHTLRDMKFLKYPGKGYIPTYTRSQLTDDLHKAFGFDTSKEIIKPMKMRSICAGTKRPAQAEKTAAKQADHEHGREKDESVAEK